MRTRKKISRSIWQFYCLMMILSQFCNYKTDHQVFSWIKKELGSPLTFVSPKWVDKLPITCSPSILDQIEYQLVPIKQKIDEKTTWSIKTINNNIFEPSGIPWQWDMRNWYSGQRAHPTRPHARRFFNERDRPHTATNGIWRLCDCYVIRPKGILPRFWWRNFLRHQRGISDFPKQHKSVPFFECVVLTLQIRNHTVS